MRYIGKNILNHTLNVKNGNISGSSHTSASFGTLNNYVVPYIIEMGNDITTTSEVFLNMMNQDNVDRTSITGYSESHQIIVPFAFKFSHVYFSRAYVNICSRVMCSSFNLCYVDFVMLVFCSYFSLLSDQKFLLTISHLFQTKIKVERQKFDITVAEMSLVNSFTNHAAFDLVISETV